MKKKTLLGLLASFFAAFLSVCSLYPVDVWAMPVFRPYARTSRLRRWLFAQHIPSQS
jgi:hypothetical protein